MSANAIERLIGLLERWLPAKSTTDLRKGGEPLLWDDGYGGLSARAKRKLRSN